MGPVEQSSVGNRLLRRLHPDEFGALQPGLERVSPRQGNVVVHPKKPFDYVYFPESGLSSTLLRTKDGHKHEVGLVGREGMISVALVLGAESTPLTSLVQITGVWLRISASAFRVALLQHSGLRELMMIYTQYFLLMLSTTAVSNAVGNSKERLARWLLMTHDRIEQSELALTHDLMSIMLSVSRPSVTLAVQSLEKAGVIAIGRGSITIVDRCGLSRIAGDSYGTAEAEYERCIGPFSSMR